MSEEGCRHTTSCNHKGQRSRCADRNVNADDDSKTVKLRGIVNNAAASKNDTFVMSSGFERCPHCPWKVQSLSTSMLSSVNEPYPSQRPVHSVSVSALTERVADLHQQNSSFAFVRSEDCMRNYQNTDKKIHNFKSM